MTEAEKELLLSRIMSGISYVNINQEQFVLKEPDIVIKHQANLLYQDVLHDLRFAGMYTEETIKAFLWERLIWSNQQSAYLAQLEKNIETLKIGIFESEFRSETREVTRKGLRKTEAEYNRMFQERHSFDYLTKEFIAATAKSQLLLIMSVCTMNGNRVADEDPEYLFPFLDAIIQQFTESRISEQAYRLIARTEPWQTYWGAAAKDKLLFDRSICNYTTEQKTLMWWSRLYENSFNSQFCPNESVIEDDDAFDGWLFVQKRKHRQDNIAKKMDALFEANPKLRGANEIYVKAESEKDIEEISELNSPVAKMIKNQRFQYLEGKGEVSHWQLPDVEKEKFNTFTEMRKSRGK